MKKPKLLVLGVAINEYAITERNLNGEHNLNGCHNDLNGVEKALKDCIDEKKWDFEICKLFDQKATKQNIIDNFLSFFSALEDGDSALFYFSGHGSQAHAPEEFWHSMQGRLMETLVCYDSRMEERKDCRDLYDKELSYLIWKVTYGKGIHFTVIMDCCHSESITRSKEEKEQDEQEGVRMLDADESNKPWKDYLGVSEYRERGNQVSVPVGKHILIAACRRNEKAKERNIEFKSRGIFTYGLIHALKSCKGNITYGDLLERIKERVYNLTIGQNPVLEVHGVENARQQYFLGGGMKKRDITFLVWHHPEKGWHFNQGAINGLVQEFFSNSTIKLYTEELEDEKVNFEKWEEVSIDTIYPTYSSLKMPECIGKNQRFKASLYRTPKKKLAVTILSTEEQEGFIILNKVWESKRPDFLSLKDKVEDAKYLIRIEQEQTCYTIQTNVSSIPLFRSPQGFQVKNANLLIDQLEKIANWHLAKEIENPLSNIRKEELNLSFYKIIEIDESGLEILDEKKVSDFLIKPPKLKYRYNKSTFEYDEPAFHFRIENPLSNRRTLWVAVLFLGIDYSIDNKLCPLKMLQPGEVYCLESIDLGTGMYTKIIHMHLQDEYASSGIEEITEHFKILIATDEFDTHQFNQCGISLIPESIKTRGRRRISELEKQKMIDWKAIDFSVKIVREHK